MNLIEKYLGESSKEEILIHASKNKLQINKEYKAKKSKGTFGDWEVVFDKLRPSGTISRLECFFAVKRKNQIGNSGAFDYKYVYKIKPIGKYDKCQTAWLGKLMNELTGYSKGYKVNYGYLLNLKELIKNDREVIKKYLENYYKNKKIKLDYEISFTEYLCPKIKIIEEMNIF